MKEQERGGLKDLHLLIYLPFERIFPKMYLFLKINQERRFIKRRPFFHGPDQKKIFKLFVF